VLATRSIHLSKTTSQETFDLNTLYQEIKETILVSPEHMGLTKTILS